MPPFCARNCAAASAWRLPSSVSAGLPRPEYRRCTDNSVCPWRNSRNRVGAPRAPVQPAGDERRRRFLRRLCGGLDFGGGIHRLVGQPVGVAVLGARDPGVGDVVEPGGQRGGLLMQVAISGCLTFQRPDICSTTSLESIETSTSVAPSSGGLLKSRDQAAVFGDVVGGPPIACLPSDSTCRDLRTRPPPVPRRPRVATRAAVGLDNDLHGPDSLIRNRIAPHSGQRNTSSSAAAEIRASSPLSISIRHAPQRRACSSPAPRRPVPADVRKARRDRHPESRPVGRAARRIGVAPDRSRCAPRRAPLGIGELALEFVDAASSRPARSAAPRGAPSPPATNPPGWTDAVPTSPTRVAVRELFGVGGPRREQRAVAVLALTDRVDLAFELRHLRVKVLERDLQQPQALVGLAVLRLRRLDLLLLGAGAWLGDRSGSVRRPARRARAAKLLNDFSFHVSFLSTFHGSVRTADTRTGSESPKWRRTDLRPARTTEFARQCATSISATSASRLSRRPGDGADRR